MQRINNDWEYTPRWSEDFMRFETPAEAVRLPHNVGELPLHCASPENYEGLVGYRKRLLIPEGAAGRRVFLQFDAAAHIATVYCNRQAVAQHSCGYTAFRAEITSLVTPGEACEIAVKLDTSENEGIPPFGFVIDYLTYGGLYRDARAGQGARGADPGRDGGRRVHPLKRRGRTDGLSALRTGNGLRPDAAGRAPLVRRRSVPLHLPGLPSG